MQQIERGIYYENTYLGVTLGGLVFAHGTIYIDAPLRAEDSRLWRSTLLNQRGGTNRLLVNLDAHPDRTLGARLLDCTVVAHQKTAAVFRNRPTIFKGQNNESGSTWESYNDAIGMRWAPPDITFTTRMSLHWGGPEVVLDYHPGPTPGSVWVIIPAHKVIFVGDTITVNQPPFLASADLADWTEALDELVTKYGDYAIISGRGGLVTLEDVRAQQKYIKDLSKHMERLSKHNAAPEATEKLIRDLMAHYSVAPELEDAYTQRLRHGLYQYYSRRYRPASALEHQPLEDSEQ